jgi:hypothetical protein
MLWRFFKKLKLIDPGRRLQTLEAHCVIGSGIISLIV